jgi:hypothetical protein
MSIRVTLHVFSGRENPSWILPDNQADDLSLRIAAVNDRTLTKPSGVLGGLGYQGFTLSRAQTSSGGPLSLYVHDGIVDRGQQEENLLVGNRDLEKWLLESAPATLSSSVRQHVFDQLLAPALAPQLYQSRRAAAGQCGPCSSADAPAYKPATWNIPTVQPYNNCYNYANDQRTNTFAQPGRAHGAMTSTMDCSHVNTAAQADGLTNTPGFTSPLGTGHGWYVALVIWPGVDYHWYRQDSGGCWSHKPGQTAVRDVDNSGNKIADPSACNRGPYVNFCTYMITKRSVVIS